MPNWIPIREIEDVRILDEMSKGKPCLIYKHSTRCSISSLAKTRLEKGWELSDEDVSVYYLDLITYRGVSNYIAEHYGVQHESPQVLLIKNGQCLYHQSHLGISAREITHFIRESFVRTV
ncbi:MAG: bacillithiol system redox-active protein YtxJ [Saprospiraceae bacterium]|nr:bacillithiol system redox-active protein YtxJ [Saprospiraceae bacterium]